MKAIKTILVVFVLFLATSASAQDTYVSITMKDGTKYELLSDDIATMKIYATDWVDPNATTGTAGGHEWVQLWADGPRFATMTLCYSNGVCAKDWDSIDKDTEFLVRPVIK